MASGRDLQLIEILKEAALEADQRELGDVDRATPIEALELDSVSFMQVVSHFEDALDRRLPSQAFSRVRTVGDFFDVVEGHAP